MAPINYAKSRHSINREKNENTNYQTNHGATEFHHQTDEKDHSHHSRSRYKSQANTITTARSKSTEHGKPIVRKSSSNKSDCKSKSRSHSSNENEQKIRFGKECPAKKIKCRKSVNWQGAKYIKDECGSGIRPVNLEFKNSRKYWCRTPLTMYQSSVGELGRKLLCREIHVPRNVRPEPPSNMEAYVLPLCRGYYRRYDCLRPCERQFLEKKECFDPCEPKKAYRDHVHRYWDPCTDHLPTRKLEFAPHNAALAKKLLRYQPDDIDVGLPCW